MQTRQFNIHKKEEMVRRSIYKGLELQVLSHCQKLRERSHDMRGRVLPHKLSKQTNKRNNLNN